MRLRTRPVVLACLVAAAVAGSVAIGARAEEPVRTSPRVLLLGFDGAAAQVAERLLAENRLPHLAALRDRGGYSPLLTSNPAQSPVSWASMTTGRNPGETGIYDFLRRRFTPGVPGVDITIGLAEPVSRVLVTPVQRAAAVFLAGVVGCVAGFVLARWGIGRFAPQWRKGGRLQAAICAPGALLAVGALVVLSWVPEKVPFARNLRGGEPFWMTLDKAGRVCEALEAPLAFPAEPMEHGSCLAGLGVPDVQGTWGTWALWSDDPEVPAETETAGTGWFVEPGTDAFDLVLPGPLDPRPDVERLRAVERDADAKKYEREVAFDWGRVQRRRSETEEGLLRLLRRLRTSVHVELQRSTGARVTTVEGVTVDLSPGRWSDPVPVAFPVSPLARFAARGRIPGRVRFLLTYPGTTPDAKGTPGTFRLFVAPVNIDPTAELPPNLAIASPPAYARELAEAAGPFETLGWPELTNPVKDASLEDAFFLDHIRAVMKGREDRLMARIEAGGWDCLFAMFCETDRVQHVLWRHTDPQSPTYDPETSPRFAGEVDRIYEEMDRIVGRAVEAVGPDTVVLVVSDHGFAPFHRGVNLNNFLRSIGMQVSLEGAHGGVKSVGDLNRGKFFEDVDWSRTRAYAMGLGNLYLNLAGREPGGIVGPEEKAALLDEIRTRLLELRDHDGAKVVRDVYLGSDLYHGARAHEAPDLVVGFEWGYRVSWQTCLGALDPDIITDNDQQWSADHCSVDPSLVPGILFSSLPLRDGPPPSILDVAPSLLEVLGVQRADLEGASFLRK